MAHAGQVLKTGSLTMTIRRCDAEVLDLVAVYPPGGQASPEHFHPHQAESFEVLSGTLEVVLEGESFSMEAGQFLEIPPMARHQVWNSGEEPVRVRWKTWPSLRTARFYETLADLAEQGRLPEKGSPPLLQMAVLLAEYGEELRLTRPPRPIQKILIGLLAPLGWLFGYHSRPRRLERAEA